MFPQLLLDNEESQYVEGTRTYVRFIKWVARYNNNITTYNNLSNKKICRTHCEMRGIISSWIEIVKLRQGSGKEGQGMALKAKGLKA